MNHVYSSVYLASSFHKVRGLLGAVSLVLALQATHLPAQAAELEESVQFEATKLVLNGTADVKVGGLKAGHAALYLPDRVNAAEQVLKLNRPVVMQLHIDRDLSGSMLSRMYLNDFKVHASDEEFKRLIPVISKIGAAYANVKSLTKGDVVAMQWSPVEGFTANVNGKPVYGEDNTPMVIKDKLAFEISLRRYVGPKAPEVSRNGLLGGTHIE